MNLWMRISVFLFCALSAQAETQREQKAHVHGAAQVSIAFDGKLGEITYDGAAQNIYGFEYVAKSTADKKKQSESLKKFEKNILKLIQFDPDLKCLVTEARVSPEQEGNHSDVKGQFKISCDRTPLGTKIKLDFVKDFPTLQKMEIQLLADSVQKNIKIDHFPFEFEIK